MFTAIEIIEKWPSISAFASDLGVPYQNAFRMKKRNSIPTRHWDTVVRAAKSRDIKGVTLESLLKSIEGRDR